MAPGPEADGLYLEQLLELTDLIETSLRGSSKDIFLADRDKRDVTAFRLAQIGELTNKLSTDLKQRHPEISWRSVYAFRNLAVHHYRKVNPEIVWSISTNSLVALAQTCRLELDRLDG